MKTFREFMTEATLTELNDYHQNYYHDWGLIHPSSGKLISGPSHPSARTHHELKMATMDDSSPSDRLRHSITHYPEYLDEKGSGLTLRTRHNSESIKAALTGLKKLPSSTGLYHHEHEDVTQKTGTTEAQMRTHLKGLHDQIKKEESETAKDRKQLLRRALPAR
jgi:hypothetical protein